VFIIYFIIFEIVSVIHHYQSVDYEHIPDNCYYRNVSCPINKISTFLLLNMCVFIYLIILEVVSVYLKIFDYFGNCKFYLKRFDYFGYCKCLIEDISLF